MLTSRGVGLIDGCRLAERDSGTVNFGQLLTNRVLVEGYVVLGCTERAAEMEVEVGTLISCGQVEAVQSALPGWTSIGFSSPRAVNVGGTRCMLCGYREAVVPCPLNFVAGDRPLLLDQLSRG